MRVSVCGNVCVCVCGLCVVVSVFPKWKKIESVVEIGSENELTIQKRLRIGGDCAMLLLPFTVGSGAGWRL